ncbi:Putative auto-transporter adhesin, head GIN domain [Rugamonas rubra]|uniref:Putative auto-transporter adhesin, head GIN domain n=2 Tax=Rugamonas rubra TaxID=758825 RepID=A0A1I4KRR8_9BURK|nr:Putative auto-transporter adhesin, head GIN domain [Rugamonas rubra]
MTLSGSSATLSAELSGSGRLDARQLAVARAFARSRGPGNIHLNKISDALEAEMSGSGELQASPECNSVKLTMSGPGQVKLDGRTQTLSAQLRGSGELDGRHLQAEQADVQVRGPGSAQLKLKPRLQTANSVARLVTIDRDGQREGRE